MEVLKQDELMNVNGGGSTLLTIASAIAGVGIFIIGGLDGFFRPLACNK